MRKLEEKVSRYHRSEVTMVALFNKKTKMCYNVYSVVELCTQDQLQSEKIGDDYRPYTYEKINNNYTLFIRREFFDSPQRGYAFFKASGERPIFADKNAPQNDVLYDHDEMTAEPNGEEGLLFHYGSYPEHKLTGIIPAFEGTYRIYLKMSKCHNFIKVLPDEVVLKIGLLIKEKLGIDFLSRQEYWGSVFLCLPNLYVKRVRLRLGRKYRKMPVRIIPKKGQDLLNGTIEFVDERRLGIGFCIRQNITENKFVVDMPNEPELLKCRIYTKEGELVYESANYFVKAINVEMAIGGSRRIFNIPERNETVTVDMKTYERFSIGNAEEQEYVKRLMEEEKKRSIEFLTKNNVFLYFPGKKQDNDSRNNAVKTVKDIINSAKKTCILCDPYFSRNDFVEYGIMISSFDITLHIVTSEKFLIQPLSKTDRTPQGQLLKDILEQCEGKVKVECHVLEGRKQSPLHDRFMVVDDKVYVLGSSFSEFGSRATMLYQIPNPEPLMDEGTKWARNEGYCIPLKEWLTKEGLL